MFLVIMFLFNLFYSKRFAQSAGPGLEQFLIRFSVLEHHLESLGHFGTTFSLAAKSDHMDPKAAPKFQAGVPKPIENQPPEPFWPSCTHGSAFRMLLSPASIFPFVHRFASACIEGLPQKPPSKPS